MSSSRPVASSILNTLNQIQAPVVGSVESKERGSAQQHPVDPLIDDATGRLDSILLNAVEPYPSDMDVEVGDQGDQPPAASDTVSQAPPPSSVIPSRGEGSVAPLAPAFCTICQENIIGDITTIPCGHGFHRQCIAMERQYRNSCPSCRQIDPSVPPIAQQQEPAPTHVSDICPYCESSANINFRFSCHCGVHVNCVYQHSTPEERQRGFLNCPTCSERVSGDSNHELIYLLAVQASSRIAPREHAAERKAAMPAPPQMMELPDFKMEDTNVWIPDMQFLVQRKAAIMEKYAKIPRGLRGATYQMLCEASTNNRISDYEVTRLRNPSIAQDKIATTVFKLDMCAKEYYAMEKLYNTAAISSVQRIIDEEAVKRALQERIGNNLLQVDPSIRMRATRRRRMHGDPAPVQRRQRVA